MKLGRAITVGILGAILVLVLVWLGGLLAGSDGDLSALAAATVFGTADGVAWVGGLLIQLALGAAAGIVYAALFEWITASAGPWIGIAIGIPQAIVAGVAVGFLPGQRLIDAGIMPPGGFYEYRGLWCIVAYVVAHVAFGVLMGSAYGATKHAWRQPARRWVELPPT